MIGSLQTGNQSANSLYSSRQILPPEVIILFSRLKMATSKGDPTGSLFGNPKMSSLEEDFTYGVTVAQTNLKIRLGVCFCCLYDLLEGKK